ncbi:MAG: ATP-binding cassette domain-containing protein [Alteromonadaceae bacterium]|nr:ATP-binding cassette domain-containing protein [Alteromonadaceae bacterium]
MPLLDIKNLTLEIDTGTQSIKALDKINLTVNSGEIRALVGESGSGKSLIVQAIAGATPPNWTITADRMSWSGNNLLSMSEQQRRQILRKDIGVVFQNALASLDPSVTLGEQLEESLPDQLVEGNWFWQRKQNRRKVVVSTVHKVGIKDHEHYLRAYPHQIPTDIGQKLMLAMALISQPKMLIADDPTRGMETTTKVQVLKLLSRLNQTRSLGILFVSHDLLAIASMSDTMTVLYCGQTVESGKMKNIRKRPLHPYTKALLDSAPSFTKDLPPKSELPTLAGTIPTLQHLPIGCRLGPRCPRAQRDCVNVPAVRKIHDHSYSCHFPLHRDKS